jgi:hypothetical protein
MSDIHSSGPAPLRLLEDTIFAFTPVPQRRQRACGWSPLAQERFIRALAAMGAVGPAAKAAGMTRRSAYRLRERVGAGSFAQAWDRALDAGRARQFDYAMDRALNGITTIRILRGGAVDVTGGPDMALVNAALRETDQLKGTKGTI